MDAQVDVVLVGGEGGDESPGPVLCEAFVDFIPVSAEDRMNLANLVKAFRVKESSCYCEFLEGKRGAVRISILAGLKAHDVGS